MFKRQKYICVGISQHHSTPILVVGAVNPLPAGPLPAPVNEAQTCWAREAARRQRMRRGTASETTAMFSL